MFEGRYALAVSPEGAVILPPAVRKEMHALWGQAPELLCFGVQFLYLCNAAQAEALLRRIDNRLCAAFAQDMPQVNAYFHAMERSVARLRPMPDGRFILPPPLLKLLDVNRGGLLTLLGVEDHLEIWNRAQLERQTRALAQKNAPAEDRPLLETPICLQGEELPCSFLRGGVPEPKRCGPCVYLRLP